MLLLLTDVVVGNCCTLIQFIVAQIMPRGSHSKGAACCRFYCFVVFIAIISGGLSVGLLLLVGIGIATRGIFVSFHFSFAWYKYTTGNSRKYKVNYAKTL